MEQLLGNCTKRQHAYRTHPGADATQLNFCWHSDDTAKSGVVRIGKSADMTSFKEFVGKASTDSYTGQSIYKVTATGLEPNTVYYYVYGSNGKFSSPVMYRTLSTEKFKLLYISDIQVSSDVEDGREEAYVWQKTLGTALDKNSDISFILSAGDQTQHGDRANEWAGTLSPAALRSYAMVRRSAITTAKAKHILSMSTIRTSTAAQRPQTLTRTTGSATAMCSLSSTTPRFSMFMTSISSPLTLSPKSRCHMARSVMHHDIYGTGHHAADGDNKLLAAIYSALIDRFEIDVCLTGHEHLYGRSFFMKDTKPVKDQKYNADGAVVDPVGTVYFTASSASGKNRIEDYDYEWLDFKYVSEEPSYSTIEFTKNSFTLKTYGVDSKKQIDECKIVKTDTTYTPVDPNYKGMDTDMLQRYLGKWYVIIQIAIEVARYVVKITSVVAPVIAKIVIKIIKALIPVIINMF